MPLIKKGALYRKRMFRARKRALMRIRGRPQSLLQPVHYFKRSVWIPAWATVQAGADRFSSLNFRLNQIPNVAELTALYDQYKINGVKVEVIPQFDTNTQAGTAPNVLTSHIMSQNWHCIDYDDAVVPTTMDTLLQYQNVKRQSCNRIIKRFIKPKFADTIFASGVISGYRPQNGFIDVTYDNVEHYGMKFGFSNNPMTLTYGLRMTFYIACKNVR